MLVLSRFKDERIVIQIPGMEEPVYVQIVDVRGDRKVRLGIEAPIEVSVHREEVYKAILAGESKKDKHFD